MSAGKGDTPRPINLSVYRDNYDAIFSKNRTTPTPTPAINEHDHTLVYNDAPTPPKDSTSNDLR